MLEQQLADKDNDADGAAQRLAYLDNRLTLEQRANAELQTQLGELHVQMSALEQQLKAETAQKVEWMMRSRAKSTLLQQQAERRQLPDKSVTSSMTSSAPMTSSVSSPHLSASASASLVGTVLPSPPKTLPPHEGSAARRARATLQARAARRSLPTRHDLLSETQVVEEEREQLEQRHAMRPGSSRQPVVPPIAQHHRRLPTPRVHQANS